LNSSEKKTGPKSKKKINKRQKEQKINQRRRNIIAPTISHHNKVRQVFWKQIKVDMEK